MASRMLHYVIALEIAKSIEIKEIDRFVAGALLPDAALKTDGSYMRSHFVNIDKEMGQKTFDWTLFVDVYYDDIVSDELYLGYMCHLIMDAVWFKRIADQYVRVYPREIRDNYYKKGYSDFVKINALLIKEYSLLKPDLVRWYRNEPLPIIKVNSIKEELIEKVFIEFGEHFNVEKQYEPCELELYPYEALCSFIKESEEVCIHECEALKNGSDLLGAGEYFVTV